MADGFVQVTPDSSGAKIDTEELTVGANTVDRQRVEVAGATAAEIAEVKNATPGASGYGLAVRAEALGAQADAAVDTDAAGSISAKLRGLVKLIVAGITVALKAATSGGCLPIKVISAASTNATSIKASAGQIYWLVVTNTNAAVRFLKLYNKASAPTVGTDVPMLTITIPGNTAGAGFSVSICPGQEFSTGIALALTTGVADADTGAVAANEIVIAGGYK